MSFIQYLKDTRGELKHVAWPTRIQTIVYAILVIAISILLSLYLGFFDFLFTRGLGKLVEILPHQSALEVQRQPVTPTSDTSTQAPTLKISTSTIK